MQWAGSLPVAAEAFLPVEFTAVQFAKVIGCAEWSTIPLFHAAVAVEQLSKLPVDTRLCSELRNLIATGQRFGIEVLAIRPAEAMLVLETLVSGAKIATDAALYIEWADPPAPVPVVGSDRLLRSPGKVRVLAGPASLQRLRGL